MLGQIPLKKIPEGDLFVISGDLTNMGTHDEILQFIEDVKNIRRAIQFKEVIITAGNHDFGFQDDGGTVRHFIGDAFTYLEDEEFMFEGKKIYGSPWQPYFYDWAFNFDPLDSTNDFKHARSIWAKIPIDTNILITHGPPKGILDLVVRQRKNAGCPILLERIQELAKLQMHVFGHIHREIDEQKVVTKKGVKFVNASTCNEQYEPINPPIVIDIK
jgi:Icc-related predicted phosphoesterase